MGKEICFNCEANINVDDYRCPHCGVIINDKEVFKEPGKFFDIDDHRVKNLKIAFFLRTMSIGFFLIALILSILISSVVYYNSYCNKDIAKWFTEIGYFFAPTLIFCIVSMEQFLTKNRSQFRLYLKKAFIIYFIICMLSVVCFRSLNIGVGV